MPKKQIELLDPEAQKLFNKFKGIDTKLRVFSESDLQENQQKSDRQRMMLIDLAYILASYFKNARFLEGVKTKEGFLRKALLELASLFNKLSQIPSYDGSVLFRFRGAPPGLGASAGIDYVISCGKTEVDCSMTAGMFSRMGPTVSHLSARLSKAFEVFADHAINTLFLTIPGNSREKMEQMMSSLHILASFSHALRSDTPIACEINGVKSLLPLVQDETGKADPNLTLLAGLNQLKPEMAKDMVRKVSAWMKQTDPTGTRFISIFNAIFEIKSLQEKFIKPPLELNNARWLLYSKYDAPPSPEKLQLAKIAIRSSASPQEETLILDSIYGNDFHAIGHSVLEQRISLANKLMREIEQSGQPADIEAEMLSNMEARIGQVRDEIIDEIAIHENSIAVGLGEERKIIPHVNPKLLNIFTRSLKRAESKAKMKNIGIRDAIFSTQDFEAMAKHFDIPIDDAKDLIALLKSCFDANGGFRRQIFEKNIPIFAWYEEKIFEFMWHYLKHISQRNDRVAFLNAFKMLIDQVKQPLKAALVLIGDFMKDSFAIGYSDRNAIMLSNQLMRSYNKELKLDIELTPEEVLKVKAGINQEVLLGLAEMIDNEYERFFEKIRTIQKSTLASLKSDQERDSNQIPFRYLVFLERELYIFMSILGGNVGKSVIRNAIRFYGERNSPLYSAKHSERYLVLLLQQLRVLIRALGRIGAKSDLPLLDALKHSWDGALHLTTNPAAAEAARQLLKWIEESRKSILEKEWEA